MWPKWTLLRKLPLPGLPRRERAIRRAGRGEKGRLRRYDVGRIAETVTDTPYGLNEIGMGAEFFSQCANVHVDSSFQHDRIVAKGDVDQF